AFTPALAHAQDSADDQLMGEDGRQWDQARASLKALPPGDMAMAVERWKILSKSNGYAFGDYAGFVMTYPGLPEQDKIRGYAEAALGREAVPPGQVVAFFDRFPPLTNPGRAHYASALYAMGRPEAATVAREAWRGGAMSDTAEAALFARIGPILTLDDHDARMDALLWSGSAAQAERQLVYTSPAKRAAYAARLAMAKGQDPASLAITSGPEASGDPGYVYNRSRFLRTRGQSSSAASLILTRPRFAVPPREPRKWVAELLAVARGVDASTAVSIAASVDDMFASGTDVSRQSFAVRDDYTSLMWLGGTKALWTLRDGRRAAPLFYRYGMAARTPQTRSKGFYWAGRALAEAGDGPGAKQYFELAAAYPDQYYGLLALERLGRPLPPLPSAPTLVPTAQQRADFEARPLTRAVREVARESDWPTAVRFFKEISDSAESEADHVLVADLARQIGRRDLGVILGQSAQADGLGNFRSIAFPLIPVPPGTNWTVVHMISRQESQFAQNAVSHAGARGLMQLMPGTAREQAGKMGLGYDREALIGDAGYNLTLGNGYFQRMLAYYNGCWPLAIAAYNAGPGNVNKWLRQNGDPRGGGIGWVEWIERIPIPETRGYVQRVLENAVVYEALFPARASYKGANPLSHFLGKPYPG
ncbi:lytic transglycosylase domain-containing protein, partial [Novosphingobium sp.]|uniref:lytic transglycosylase domain-containing protein n=1 Tax=Novosphingobium sp. TaxID=1874826 RepID=UPI00286CF16D